MSQIIESRVLNFVIHLTPATPNPYQATADYVATFLMPCTLPSWSRYVQLVIVAQFVIMFLQSTYILYIRSKTKQIHHVGLNCMGLIQLDRANHCGLCYFLYSIMAVTEIICEEFVRLGHLDQGWPNFILGVKFTVTIACAGVILWLGICHFALVKQRAVSRSLTPIGRWLPTSAKWALNIFLVIIVFAPTAAVVTTFLQLTLEYNRVKQLVMPVVQFLREMAPACSPGTCSVNQMVPQILALTRSLHHIDLLVHHTVTGLDAYIFFNALTFLLYIPFVYALFQSFKTRTSLDLSTKRQLEGVFANTVIEFIIIFSNFVLVVCATSLVQNGHFIFNPSFWLILRIGINSTIATLGNITLFLILGSLRRTNVAHAAAEVSFPEPTSDASTHKSDKIISASDSYASNLLLNSV